ncbi:MAG: Gfo/Idh/MocA family oxidoreductase [Thermoguttaceae bacterium]|jgi:predicted dehydrogenase|nr:Gfo/Idh/MocA family oxidoreductase [Thermoguttaceae bacterium]
MQRTTRRAFLRATAGAAAATSAAPYFFTAQAEEAGKPRSKNDRFVIGTIGMRYQGTVNTDHAVPYGDIVAICDVDRQIGEKAVEHYGGKATLYEDYRKVLDRKDIDVVYIGTPDHWHTQMLMDAVRAGKDVYAEKPLTLTVDEGKQLLPVVRDSGRVVQVNTRLRSNMLHRLAAETVAAGRIGKLRRVVVGVGKNPTGGPFAVEDPPSHLNWELWLGQAPLVPYIKERCHFTFRWWYEYAGGKQADIGAHQLDLAQWGMGVQHTGPVELEGTAAFPDVENGYNVATSFEVRMKYADGVELITGDGVPGGVRYEGELGWIHGRRGEINGQPFDLLDDDPIPREKFRLYAHDNLDRPLGTGKESEQDHHAGNFFDCVRSRQTPISDILSQNRAANLCHIANIAQRLGRKLRWDPEQEVFAGDDEANALLRRPQRKGFEIA